MSEEFWEEIADRAEDLAALVRPHSPLLTRLFEFAAWIAMEKIIERQS